MPHLAVCWDFRNTGLDMKIDVAWFVRKIEESHFGSQRQLALSMKQENGKPFDQSALSRIFSGDRKMHLSEAEQIARLLAVPVNEVLAHAGIRIQDPSDLVEALEHYAKGPDGKIARAALTRWRR